MELVTPLPRTARATWLAVLRWGLLALSLVFLTRLASDGWGEIRDAVRMLATRGAPLVLLAVALESAWALAMAMVYRSALVAMGGRLAARPALRVSLGAFTLSRVLPGGGAVGSVFAAREMVALGNPAALTITSMAVSWWVSMTTLGVVICTGVGLSAAAGRLDASYLVLPAVVEGVLLLIGVLGLAAVRSHRLRDRVLRLLAAAFRKLRLNAPVPAWNEAIETLAANLREPARLLRVLGWSVLVWVLDAGALWVMLAAFGYPLDPGALLVGYGLVNLISALPELTPGWLGVLETSLSVTYASFGVPSGVAVVAVLSYRLLSYWLPTAAGVPAALTLLRPRVHERQAA